MAICLFIRVSLKFSALYEMLIFVVKCEVWEKRHRSGTILAEQAGFIVKKISILYNNSVLYRSLIQEVKEMSEIQSCTEHPVEREKEWIKGGKPDTGFLILGEYV